MRKFIVLMLALCFSFGAIAMLTGCNGEADLSELLNRIDQLERDLEEARELGGLPGPQGPAGPQGIPGIQGPPGESDVQQERIYQLDETFTYTYHTGLRLFSIRVVADTEAFGGFAFYVTNHSMPGYAPDAFMRLRIQAGAGSFSTPTLPSPANVTLPMGNTARIQLASGFEGTYIFFGWPTGVTANSIIPYARFRIR